jgi:hypothetical protein
MLFGFIGESSQRAPIETFEAFVYFFYPLSLAPQLSQNFMPGTVAPHFRH